MCHLLTPSGRLLGSSKRAVHDGVWETTPMTALKQQITQKAHPVPLPSFLVYFTQLKIAPQLAPEMATGPPTIRPPLAMYPRRIYTFNTSNELPPHIFNHGSKKSSHG